MTDAPPIPRRLLRAEQVLAARSRAVSLVLEGSQDPHNVHAVLRTAEALGVQDVHLVAPRGEAAAISPGVTQRAHEWLSVRRHADVDAAARHLRDEGRSLWVTAPGGDAAPLTGFRPEGPCAVLFGNESEGVSDRARELADGCLRIDLVGFSGSLNLSVSAAIVLWELRRHALVTSAPGDLSAEARGELREQWYRKLLGKRVRDEESLGAWVARGPEIAEAAGRRPRVAPSDRLGD